MNVAATQDQGKGEVSMTIQRVPVVPFAQIANEALRDRRLSFKARGILALVLSHSGEWRATVDWLEGQSEQDGRASIATGLQELTRLGYRTVFREQVDGRIRTVVVWRHQPDKAISRPTGNLTVRISDRQETQASIEDHSLEHHKKEQQIKNKDLFDEFWAAYPRKAAKAAAVKAWAKAVRDTDPSIIIQGAIRYSQDANRDPAFTAHPATWLNGQRWLDDPIPGQRSAGERRVSRYQGLFEALGAGDDGSGSSSIAGVLE